MKIKDLFTGTRVTRSNVGVNAIVAKSQVEKLNLLMEDEIHDDHSLDLAIKACGEARRNITKAEKALKYQAKLEPMERSNRW